MSNKEKEKITNSCEDSNSQKINDEGRQILETASNALNSVNINGRMNFRKFNTNKGEIIMPNNKEELELMEACEKGELEKVKSLVEANKYNNNILEKAKSIALSNLRLDIVSYIQKIMADNDLNILSSEKDPTDL